MPAKGKQTPKKPPASFPRVIPSAEPARSLEDSAIEDSTTMENKWMDFERPLINRLQALTDAVETKIEHSLQASHDFPC